MMTVLSTVVFLIGLFLIFAGFKALTIRQKIAMSIVGIAIGLWGAGMFVSSINNSSQIDSSNLGDSGSSQSSSVSYHPGQGAVIVNVPADQMDQQKQDLSNATMTGMTDKALKSLSPNDKALFIIQQYGTGITVAEEQIIEGGQYVTRWVTDYPSADHKGKYKIALQFDNGFLTQIALKPIDWLPDQEDPNYVIRVDDTAVPYY